MRPANERQVLYTPFVHSRSFDPSIVKLSLIIQWVQLWSRYKNVNNFSQKYLYDNPDHSEQRSTIVVSHGYLWYHTRIWCRCNQYNEDYFHVTKFSFIRFIWSFYYFVRAYTYSRSIRHISCSRYLDEPKRTRLIKHPSICTPSIFENYTSLLHLIDK